MINLSEFTVAELQTVKTIQEGAITFFRDLVECTRDLLQGKQSEDFVQKVNMEIDKLTLACDEAQQTVDLIDQELQRKVS